MRKRIVTTTLTLVALAFAANAFATQYPPGPGAAYPDTLTIFNIQSALAVPHPLVPDTVRGVGGIITGFDPKPSGFGFYMQISDPGGTLKHSGIDVFTGSTNKGPSTPFNFQIGDSVVVEYGKVQEFGGGTEIEGLDASQATDDVFVRWVSSGNPVPPFYLGSMADLQELPTNATAEQWEGMLVKLNFATKVGRISTTGGLGTNNSFLLVDPACPGPICDSVFVDGNTLATYAPPAVGTVVDWVQGLFEQRSRGYRIQLRDGNDLQVATPPALMDAYPVTDTRLRVVFDRNVTTASATTLTNYSLASTGLAGIIGATMDGQAAVFIDINNGLVDGDPEAITVNGIVGLGNGLPMTSAATRNFTNGVMTPMMVQGPNAAALVAMTGCRDNANFLEANNGATARISVRGVCAGVQGALYTLMDPASGPRSGVVVFAPISPLIIGHDYLVASALQEFPSESSGESEIVGTVYIQDFGAVAIPTPVDIRIGQIADTTCDVSEVIFNGEDVEGGIARFGHGKIVANNSGSPFVAGSNFRVVATPPWAPDTFFVANNIARTFLPIPDHIVDVTGIVQFSFGAFRIQPRSDADILDPGVLSAPGTLPSKVEFGVSPNPARTARVSFGLPVRNSVHLAVFDLAGRKIATLANGEFEAGTYSRSWSGLDDSGRRVGSGVYFYRMRVGTESYTLRGIKLQ